MIAVTYIKFLFKGPNGADENSKWIFLIDQEKDTYKAFEVGKEYTLTSEEIEFIPKDMYTVVSILGGIQDSTTNGNILAYGTEIVVYNDTAIKALIDTKADKTEIANALAELTDVDVSNKTNNYVLTYDSTTQKFESKPLPNGTGSGATNLNGLSDVDVTSVAPANGNVLTYDNVAGKWKPGSGGLQTVTIANVTGLQSVLDGKAGVLHTHTLSNITDINITNKTNGFILTYDSATDKFVSKAPAAGSGSTVTSSTNNGKIKIDGVDTVVYNDGSILTSLANKTDIGHNHTLSNILDVDAANKVSGHVLTYDTTVNKFVSKALPVSGSVVTGSTNGKIKVNNVDLMVFDDSVIQTSLSGKANATHNHTLSNIIDVDVANATNGFALIYDSASSKFKAQAIPSSPTQIVVKDSFSGTANTTKTYDSDMTNFVINNTGATSLSFVINGITIPVNAGASFDDAFEPFRQITITASGAYNALVKGKPVLTVTSSLAGGTYELTQSVTLTTKESATIYYTIDGTVPTTSSQSYSGPITISTTTTLKYFAKDVDGTSSSVQTAVYTINVGGVEWTYDFVVPQSNGVYTLTSEGSWIYDLTNEDVYGPALDGVNPKMKLLTLGVQDGSPDEPGQELPRDGFDVFAAPSMHGAYSYDSDTKQFYFQSAAMNPYYFRIVKYV